MTEQPSYIITEELAELIESQLQNQHCKKCPYEGAGVNSGILSMLRSRPAPASYTIEQIADINKQVRKAAAQAREQTIKLFIDFGKSGKCCKTDDPVSCDAICEHDCTVCFAESLRTKPQEQS